jgi:hypothetical protein
MIFLHYLFLFFLLLQAPVYLVENQSVKFGQNAAWGSGKQAATSSVFVALASSEKKGWNMSAVFPDFARVNGTEYWNPIQHPALPPLPSVPSLDESQKEAIRLALSNNIGIIQGPPGDYFISIRF